MRRAALSMLFMVIASSGAALGAQTTVSREPRGIAGSWEGRLGRSGLRLILDLTHTVDGLWFGSLVSVDQGGNRFAIDQVDVAGDSLRFRIMSLGVSYVAALSTDRARLIGLWTQGGSATLELTRSMAPAAPIAPAPGTVRANTLGVPVALMVPVAPTPFAGGGKQHLVYEIQILNHAGADILVSRLDVFDGSTLAAWEGANLHAIVTQRRPEFGDNRNIPAGGWAIAHVWVTLDSAARVPSTLRHRLTIDGGTVEGTVAVARTRAVVLGPPLRGGDWIARNGPDNVGGHHRRALVPIAGETFIAQRFATDWMKVDSAGRALEGDQTKNNSYFAYGAEVLAVADGIVVGAKDGIPENVPGATSRAVAMTLETVTGNYVTVDLGQGRYAFYAHMIPGSLRVKVGDRVRRGQVIGLVGNSGNSTGPHLHFHVSDRPSPLASEGLPYVIDSWELMRGPGQWERRLDEIPLFNARVRFPVSSSR